MTINQRLARWLAAVLLAAPAAGCLSDPACPSVGSNCSGSHLVECDHDEVGTHFVVADKDCAATGQVCVDQGMGVAACVDDVPCAESYCDGQMMVTCVDGHPFSRFDCADGAAAGRTCVTGPQGPTCAYPP